MEFFVLVTFDLTDAVSRNYDEFEVQLSQIYLTRSVQAGGGSGRGRHLPAVGQVSGNGIGDPSAGRWPAETPRKPAGLSWHAGCCTGEHDAWAINAGVRAD